MNSLVHAHSLDVVQGLEFELIVYAPYRSLEGFCSDFEVGRVRA